MAKNGTTMYGRLCDLYGRLLMRMRWANSELGRFFDARRQSAKPVQLEQMEPRLLLSAVVGHHLFYNNSAFDGNNAAINIADDAAIAPDKVTLQELGQATFASYSSYDKGINGVMIDVDKLPKTPTLSDFVFRTGKDDQDLSTWQLAPNPTGLAVRKGAGVNGSDRIVLTWNDASAVKNAWLQVTVRCTANTGLYEQDVFYFGSAIGEVGNAVGSTRVDATDMLLARRNTRSLLDPAPITDPYDFNRDKKVDASDMLIARHNQTTFATDLPLVNTPLNPAENLYAEIYSPSEVRLLWQDRSQSELGYRVLMSSAETGPFAEVATTGPDATAVLLTGLPAGVTRWFHVEPIAPAGATEGLNTQAPTVEVSLPERLAGVGINDKSFRIKITSSFTHNEAGYTGEGTARLLGQGTESGYAIAVAESATAAVWKVLRGTATITDWDSKTKDHVIDSSGAYKVGKVEDLEEEIGDAGYHGFERPAVSDGQWLVVLEDTYEWQDNSWGVDEDYDDFYWTLDVEPLIDLVVNDVVGEADEVIEVVADPENYIPIIAYVPKEVEASQASLEVADGSWPEDAVLYMYDAQADQYNEIKIGDATWNLSESEDTVKYFNLRATAPFSVMQLVLRAGSESDAEWVRAGGICCACSGSRPGTNATASGGSLDFSFDLGPVDKGDSGGFVTLHSDRGTAELDTPRALHLTAHSSVTVNDSALDSSADDGEVLWLTLNGSGTESKVYVDVHSKEEGSGYSLIFKTVSGETETAFRRIKFQDGDDEAGDDYAITISRYEITNEGQTETQNGYWLAEWTPGEDEAPGTWEITTGSSPSNLQRVETHTAEYDDQDDTVRIETTTISEPSTQAVVAHVVQKFKKYDWGEERIEQTVYAGYDSGTQQYTGGQTTTWQYHTSGANTTGKLKLTVDAVGHWTYYKTYSARGYATEVIEQYGDNAFDEQSETLAADNVTTTYAEYRQWSSTDDDRIELPVSEEVLDLVAKTVITPPSSAGAPVYGYRLTRALANSTLEGYEESWDIEAVTDDPENGYAGLGEFLESIIEVDNSDGHRVWKSWRYPANSTGGDEQYAGRLKKSISPDGVVRLYDYDYANGKTTVQGGLPDSNGDIVEGSKTVTTVNDTGRATQREQYERKRENGGWILTSLVKYTVFDAYGRSKTATYWFGEEAEDELASSGTGTAAYSTTTTYTCCKTDEITGRDGVTTDYDHDSLGRVTKVATEVEDDQQNETYLYTERFAYDAASRQVETRLDVDHDGWDSTLDDDIVTSKSTYDLAGRLISIEDAEGKKAFFTYRTLDVDFDPTAGEDIRTIRESRAYGHDADSGPVSVTWTDCQGRAIRSFTAKLDDPQDDWNGSAPTGEEALDELSRAVYQYNWRGRQTAVLAYHDLTSIALSGAGTAGSAYTWGEGSSGTNYYQSTTTYAHTGQVQYATDPAGDIGFVVYDDVGRPIETWAGTELGGSWTATDPNAGTGGDITKVAETFYDDDHDRDAAEYDWRMSPTRQTGLKPLTEPELSYNSDDYTYVDYSSALDYTDNGDATDDFRVAWSKPALGAWSKQVYSIEGKRLESLTYDHTGGTLGDLLAKVASQYDGDTGWLTSARVYEVSSGSAGDYLQTTYSCDDFGRQVKTEQAGGGYTKAVFDDLGRVEREVYASNEGNDTDVIDPTTGEVDFTDDVVLTEAVYEYDDVGDVLLATVYQRAADATATGLLSDASASQSRATYSAAWYDNAHRVTHLADYGTNGGTAIPDTATGDFDPDTVGTQHYGDFTPQPDGSDYIIVTKYEYDDSGRAYKVTANDGAATVSEYDALGRTTAVIQNYDDGSPGGASGETDIDLVTRYTFDTSGRLKEQTADLPGASDDQATRYFYSGEFDADHDGTVVKSHSMLRATRYPDSTLTDQNVIDILDEAPGAPDSHDFVAATYNAAGLAATTTDQREVVHGYAFDEIGRLTADTVTLPEASDVDDSVLAITSIYDALGRVARITSHSDADPDTDGFTDAVNQIEYAYDGWGNRVTEKQEHDGAVDGETLTVQYAYDWADAPQTDEAAPYLRLSRVTYPDGREVYYNYYAGGIADDISRISEIADDDLNEGGRTRYAVYGYLGAGVIVTVEHPAVSGGLTLDYGSDGSGGWDDFGRVTGQTWTNSAETTTFDDFAYAYDRASNRVTRVLSLTTGLDEKYTYDGLNRLANTERGTLTGGSITNLAFEQDWSLDALGNWAEFNQDDDGTGGWDLEQDRDHNEANEITDLSGSWVDPAHDLAGNMTLAARPADETSAEEGLVLVYDAWNRPVKVYVDADEGRDPDAGELLATYEYDGQTRRIVETIEGVPDVVRDSYYSDAWQVIEVHEGGDADNPLKQFVWDPRYVDSPIVRFHDGNTDGAIDDTLYYTTDANMNVTAVVDTSGAVVERYAYDPYGQVTILNGADGADPDVDGETVFEWDPDADGVSDVDNRTLYAGYHFDTETGLYSVRHRMYHPTLGRWVTRDPIGYADGMSLYEYCRSGPLGATDATGLRPMGPQDPGYQPGYETLPWKDVPETDKKCPCPCDGEEFIPPWEPELEPGAGVVPVGGALGLGDWRDYVYLGEWEGWEKEYGLDLKSLVERAADTRPRPIEQEVWDRAIANFTPHLMGQLGVSVEGSMVGAGTVEVGTKVYSTFDKTIWVPFYIESGPGVGTIHAGGGVVVAGGVGRGGAEPEDFKGSSRAVEGAGGAAILGSLGVTGGYSEPLEGQAGPRTAYGGITVGGGISETAGFGRVTKNTGYAPWAIEIPWWSFGVGVPMPNLLGGGSPSE